MSESSHIVVTNVLLTIHNIFNFGIAFLGIPATVLYMLDFVIDTESVGPDNIFITAYLMIMTLLQIF